ncbi:MAG: hypothetical protein J6Z33_07965 [Lachnospiraceae bacterium]|nr:hypothetical protein [Lachnospiraceae bacterium]
MKRRHRAKSDILIDLTSLLDVIFIVLLVVIGRQMNLTDQQAEQVKAGIAVEEATAQAEVAHAKYSLYLDQLDTADTLNQMVCALTVYCYYSENDVTERYVEILRKGDAEPTMITMRGENVSAALQSVKNAIIEYVQDNHEFPVILSLNEGDERILYRDEKAIKKIFEELSVSADYPNVYVKYGKYVK